MVHIGAIFDADSTEGAAAEISMSLAISDFYALHSNYRTRVVLHIRNTKELVGTAAAVMDLLRNVEVHAIIGPQLSDAAPFVIKLGEKTQVPILSFFDTSPTLSLAENPYFIRAVQDDSNQVKAIAAIVQEFEWYEAVIVYEDTDFSNGMISNLVDALQVNNIRVVYMIPIPTSAKDFHISRELDMLMTKQTRVFIVHMTTSLGSRFFTLVNKAGMMSEGYAWFMTTAMSNSINDMDPQVIDSMEGVLGIRPYVPMSNDLENFKQRWKRNLLLKKPKTSVTEPNIFSLWAYDTIWALARATERIEATDIFFDINTNESSSTDFTGLGFSKIGPRLLNEIPKTKFKGVSGEFHLVNGQLQTSTFELVNVIGRGERVVGYWTPDNGIFQKLGSTSNKKLKKIIWPGDSTRKPKCWAVPKLRIGIPVKLGFTQFVNSYKDSRTNETKCGGLSCDVFLAALDKLDFNVTYEFIPFEDKNGSMAGSYNELIEQVARKKYDAVVGDTTILANRTKYVDFTMPYTESGVAILVPVRQNKHSSMWIFFRPWSWDLWLSVLAACIITALVLRIMEHQTENTEFGVGAPPKRQLFLLMLFPFYALALPQREMVVRECSKLVLIIWLCLAFILMQSYTASLSSMLTLDQLQPTFDSVKDLREKGYYIGYKKNSFVKDLLLQLKFNDSKLIAYNTADEYLKALSKGSEYGGVAAIFEEIPYVRIFLAKYGSKFMMAGPTYRTDGFGFAFPKDSPLVPYLSRAILEVREGDIMDKIEERYFGDQKVTVSYAGPSISTESSSLKTYSFGGLFIIAGIAILLALLISERYIWQKPIFLAKQFSLRFLSSHSSDGTGTEIVPQTTTEMVATEVVESFSGDSERSSSQIRENIFTEEDNKEQ
ncbi:Glutamate receptor [Melia azedarach]|uniref:Glutamate receptor n=1 Tax=Melia azedarach TaxID=155640 RepID=A0ACC1XDX9_MELAZ|nr:Glutamate receptor [Melia azedarach]